MSPRRCRQLASELRQYGEDHPAYWARARDAADRLEALADEMKRRGIGEDDDQGIAAGRSETGIDSIP